MPEINLFWEQLRKAYSKQKQEKNKGKRRQDIECLWRSSIVEVSMQLFK